MLDGEQLIAEKDVPLRDDRVVQVQISQHADEEFWRVAFKASDTTRGPANITVGAGESFMMSLIQEAIGGQQGAWNHLAQWGHSTLLRPATVLRTAVA
jgi:hypothetical protein